MGLAATGICSMIGASINVVPFMIHRNVPGIGPYVLPAFLFAAVPAVLAALAYSILASAMPRAGGSYVYASRAINPYLGFVASFSQWFGLSIVIGAVSYILVAFFRDIASSLGGDGIAAMLEIGAVRLLVALVVLWLFVIVNIRGVRSYEKTVVPLMFLMFAFGLVVIAAGISYTQEDFIAAALEKGQEVSRPLAGNFKFTTFLSASAVLFASFIGFDSIAQAGGEARNPSRNLPLAIGLAVLIVGSYYFVFTAAVYHTVPWNFVASEALTKDVTAPGLLSYLLPAGWAVAISAGATISLLNDLPSMLLAVSRLMFAWAEDGIFPKAVARVHPRHHSPYRAILASGIMATVGILGCHFASDFFLGVDIMVTSMLVNFLLMCLAVIVIARNNPTLFKQIKVIPWRPAQLMLAWAGFIVILGFLIIHVMKDMTAPARAWYFRSTWLWLMVMAAASLIFIYNFLQLKRKGVNIRNLFSNLPPE